MPEHETHATIMQDGEPVNTTVAFEHTDVSVSGVERVGVGLGIVIVVVLAVTAVTFHFLTNEQPLGTPEIAAGVRTNARPLPPAPQMQGIPGDAVPPPEQQREFQDAASTELHSYGWIDAQQGVAHIPIEDAMQQLLKNGLPQPAATTTAAGVTNGVAKVSPRAPSQPAAAPAPPAALTKKKGP